MTRSLVRLETLLEEEASRKEERRKWSQRESLKRKEKLLKEERSFRPVLPGRRSSSEVRKSSLTTVSPKKKLPEDGRCKKMFCSLTFAYADRREVDATRCGDVEDDGGRRYPRLQHDDNLTRWFLSSLWTSDTFPERVDVRGEEIPATSESVLSHWLSTVSLVSSPSFVVLFSSCIFEIEC